MTPLAGVKAFSMLRSWLSWRRGRILRGRPLHAHQALAAPCPYACWQRHRIASSMVSIEVAMHDCFPLPPPPLSLPLPLPLAVT